MKKLRCLIDLVCNFLSNWINFSHDLRDRNYSIMWFVWLINKQTNNRKKKKKKNYASFPHISSQESFPNQTIVRCLQGRSTCCCSWLHWLCLIDRFMWPECLSFNLSSHGEVNLFISCLSACQPGKLTGVGFRRWIIFAENKTLAPGNQKCLDGCKQSSCS